MQTLGGATVPPEVLPDRGFLYGFCKSQGQHWYFVVLHCGWHPRAPGHPLEDSDLPRYAVERRKLAVFVELFEPVNSSKMSLWPWVDESSILQAEAKFKGCRPCRRPRKNWTSIFWSSTLFLWPPTLPFRGACYNSMDIIYICIYIYGPYYYT